MSENISMTRISDLPVIGSGSMHTEIHEPQFNDSNIYIPLNPHPNPYGIKDQGYIPPPHHQSKTENTQQGQQGHMQQPQQQGHMQQPQQGHMQQPQQQGHMQPEYRLPQRDIPMDITDFTHDEQIQPNYIPKPKLTSDYVNRHEKATISKIREYEEEQKKEAVINQWIDQLYQPMIIGILYFIFQLPIINTLVFKRFSFLSIYKEDGNFNLLGIFIKSLLFSSTFLFFEKIAQYLIYM